MLLHADPAAAVPMLLHAADPAAAVAAATAAVPIAELADMDAGTAKLAESILR